MTLIKRSLIPLLSWNKGTETIFWKCLHNFNNRAEFRIWINIYLVTKQSSKRAEALSYRVSYEVNTL